MDTMSGYVNKIVFRNDENGYTVAELFGGEVAEDARVLYGGSMNPGNVEALVVQPDIDGGLVGGASLKAESFVQLIEACL